MLAQEEIADYADVQSEYVAVAPKPTGISYNFSSAGIPPEIEEQPYITADFNALLQANPDTVGWLAIPDAELSYPVVQAADNAKYLDLSFQGKRSNAGTPFADFGNDLQELDAHTILYGHNMGAGRTDMFGSLLSYKDSGYFDTHRYIWFDTIHQQHGWWKVFAVIEHDMRAEDFSYLRLQFDTEADFTEWITEVKARSIHGSDLDIGPDDHILTLSTCDRSKYGRNGRLLVLAVKTSIKED